ncbi:MAG: energy-coupling factor transporter transmembrane protein EcfT [Defluviitaleaceae bacterium]|nr:energy-coupling factor transporter transmembrane protein EcfT [Defluviitaleaceae bacterium]
MFLMHPVALAISFFCAAIYSIYLSGKKFFVTGIKFLFPMMIFAATINPLFNHQGVTILAYLPNGNPLTAEAIFFGAGAAVMLGAVITWFSCFNAVMTADKFIFLFARIAPAVSLIFSMSLRFVPRFAAQIKIISDAQKGIGKNFSHGNFFQRARNGIKIFSIAVTWALENSVETAAAMNARGYGLAGRTTFSIFYFSRRDFFAAAFIAACSCVVIFFAATGAFYFRYFPVLRGEKNLFVFAAYFFLCAFPIILNLKEDLTFEKKRRKGAFAWKFSK